VAATIDPPILPRLLYRYRKIDKFDREIETLKEGYLWLSEYGQLNDPMEGFYERSPRVRKERETYKAALQEIFDQKQQIGICCFSDTPRSEIMWTHYGSNYEGICVGYKPLTLVRALPEASHLIRIAYGGSPPEINSGHTSEPQRAAVRILSHKKESWSYEREWRILGTPGRVDIPTTCIGEVYMGSRVTDKVRDALKRELVGTGVGLWAMRVNGYSHEFEKVNLKTPSRK
jgi:hypothetical protein